MYTKKVEETWFERAVKNIKLWFVMLFHGLFRGMKEADTAMVGQVNGGDGDAQEISHRLELDGVYADILREKKTQEVLELIDSSYRVAREADKYEVTLVGDLGDESVDSEAPMSAVAVKKVLTKYEKHPEVFNERTYHITLIQDNKKIQNTEFRIPKVNEPEEDFGIPILELEYDGFMPRFKLEKYITRMVIRETKAGKTKLDFYINSEAGRFTKKDAILIAELHRIMENGTKKVDFLDIKNAKFVTDKAYGAENLVEYHLEGLKFNKISTFDGSFVLTFNVSPVKTFDIVKSHKTKSLDKKYDKMEAKNDTISIENIGAIERRNEKLAKKHPNN